MGYITRSMTSVLAKAPRGYHLIILVLLLICSPCSCFEPPAGPKRMMQFPLNFIERSPYLDQELAGDAGFDPLRFVKSREDLFFYREAEIKHARLGMLGSLGWPVSELTHKILSNYLNLPNMLEDGRVPSVLNGGLTNEVFLASLGGVFVVGAVLELELIRKKKEVPEGLQNFFNMWREEGFEVPGNYNFDPLRLAQKIAGDDMEKRKLLQTIELFNGRMSMLAVVGFTSAEAWTGRPVVEETPQFFNF